MLFLFGLVESIPCLNHILNYVLDMVGKGRIVFGMDFPAYNPGPEISKVRDADIAEAQKKKIMGEKAARILGL